MLTLALMIEVIQAYRVTELRFPRPKFTMNLTQSLSQFCSSSKIRRHTYLRHGHCLQPASKNVIKLYAAMRLKPDRPTEQQEYTRVRSDPVVMNILLLLFMKSVFADMKPLFSGISCRRRTAEIVITGIT
jgi:hypothetical protein